MPLIPMFAPDYPGAIIVPCDSSNCYSPAGHGGVENQPSAGVLHTPEERADNIEVTPYYFQTPGIEASTHFYGDDDGDMYQMVPTRFAAIANGVRGMPRPIWVPVGGSANWFSWNIEIEGRAHSLHQTMPIGGRQWGSLTKLAKHQNGIHKIPPTRAYNQGHYELANNRQDPGFTQEMWQAYIRDIQGGVSDVFVIHDRDARLGDKPGGWAGKTYGVGNYRQNLRADYGLPANAKMVRVYEKIDVPMNNGVLSFGHGGGGFAGNMSNLNSVMELDLMMDANGWCDFSVIGGSITFRTRKSIGYWVW